MGRGKQTVNQQDGKRKSHREYEQPHATRKRESERESWFDRKRECDTEGKTDGGGETVSQTNRGTSFPSLSPLSLYGTPLL